MTRIFHRATPAGAMAWREWLVVQLREDPVRHELLRWFCGASDRSFLKVVEGYADTVAGEPRSAGCSTITAYAAYQLTILMADRAAAVVVLADLPDLPESLGLLRRLRTGYGPFAGVDPNVPVIVCSGSGGELCERLALEAGADDFRVLPASPGVLRARGSRG